jgi:hypothetical protein
MWKCETIDEELIRIRNLKMIRDNNRVDEEHIEKLKTTIRGQKKSLGLMNSTT